MHSQQQPRALGPSHRRAVAHCESRHLYRQQRLIAHTSEAVELSNASPPPLPLPPPDFHLHSSQQLIAYVLSLPVRSRPMVCACRGGGWRVWCEVCVRCVWGVCGVC